jgi:hypothetical protein
VCVCVYVCVVIYVQKFEFLPESRTRFFNFFLATLHPYSHCILTIQIFFKKNVVLHILFYTKSLTFQNCCPREGPGAGSTFLKNMVSPVLQLSFGTPRSRYRGEGGEGGMPTHIQY